MTSKYCMLTTIIALVMNGHTLFLDAESLYNVFDVPSCRTILPMVIEDYGAKSGYCFTGDMLLPPEST